MTAHIPDNEKAERVFTALQRVPRRVKADGPVNRKKPRPRLTLKQIAEETRMTVSQAERGWSILRQTSPTLVVMEPHRQNSVYYFTEEFNDGMSYLHWQCKHIYARVNSAQVSVGQLTPLAAAHPDVAKELHDTEMALNGAWAGLKNALKELEKRSDIKEPV